jgi:ABC-type lipoprotein export system ATPase subunit
MPTYVKSVQVTGLHGRFDLKQTFLPGVNILYGKNGTGKTTLLHILANVLNGDFKRFAYLHFRTIEVEVDGVTVVVTRKTSKDIQQLSVHRSDETVATNYAPGEIIREDRELEREAHFRSSELKPTLPAAYFPAFRTMIEAWASMGMRNPQGSTRSMTERDYMMYKRRHTGEVQVESTIFARELFGPFVPYLSYPSPIDIEFRLTNEIERAMLTLAQKDRDLLARAFVDVFAALSPTSAQDKETRPDALLDQIRSLSERFETFPFETSPATRQGTAAQPVAQVYESLRHLVSDFQVGQQTQHVAVPVLEVYRQLLEERVNAQQEVFAPIKQYLASVNEFLDGKELEARAPGGGPSSSAVRLRFNDGSPATSLKALSSGERQIVTLIYAATHMNTQKVVLIDEPELSLHVDWQRMLLPKMAEQLQDLQIIACTHSPVIGADYEDRLKELTLKKTSRQPGRDETRTEDEETVF